MVVKASVSAIKQQTAVAAHISRQAGRLGLMLHVLHREFPYGLVDECAG